MSEPATVTVTNTPVTLVQKCDPWREPFKCPLLLYTILVVIGVIINLVSISRAPNVDKNGRFISSTQKWTAAIIGLIIYLIIAYLFGHWMYNLCRKCETLNSWLVFILAVLFPLILAVIIGVIVASLLGVSYFLWA